MTNVHAHAHNDDWKRRVQNIYEGVYKKVPYFKNFPCEILDIDEGWVRLGFNITHNLCNYRGIASGGVLAAFCDTLMGMASRTLGDQVTTLEINMNYVRSVKDGSKIVGVGQVVHHGGQTIVAECEFFDEDGKIIVKGRSSFYILKKM